MNYIKSYNTLNKEECNSIINYRNRIKSDYSDLVIWLDNKIKNDVFDIIEASAYSHIVSYLKEFNSLHISDVHLDGIAIIKQKSGAHDNRHHDSPTLIRKSGKVVTRPFVCLIYLNEDFDGGELVFDCQKHVIKPETGKMVIFPASFMYPHQVLPISGERYFVRLNYFVSSIDGDIDEWDIEKDGVMKYE